MTVAPSTRESNMGEFEWLTPEVREMAAKMTRHDDRVRRVTHWMRHVPLVGRLVESFWFGLLANGVRDTLAPRWGALTFAFLNDGFRPTLWHAWHNITCRKPIAYDEITGNVDSCNGCAIFIDGAPRNWSEANRNDDPSEVQA